MADPNNNLTSKSVYCCEAMKEQMNWSCEIHTEPFDCADSIIYYSESLKAFGLLIHDGGSSSLKISFCPFCGTSLQKND